MTARIQRWGNSLAVRIPKSLAAQLQLEHNSEVEVMLIDGHIAVVPVHTPDYRLDDLLAGVREDNMHHEISTGDAVGQEAW